MSFTEFRNDFLAEVESRLASVDVSTASVNELLVNGALYKMAGAVASQPPTGPSALSLLEAMSAAEFNTWMNDASNRVAFNNALISPASFAAIVDSPVIRANIAQNAMARLLFSSSQPALATSIPTMTSNSAPSGSTSASSNDGTGFAAWKAFDKDAVAGYWRSALNQALPQWLRYSFPAPVAIHTLTITTPDNNQTPITARLEYSVDGTTWVNGDSLTLAQNQTLSFNVSVAGKYRHWRVFILTNGGSTQYVTIHEMQLIGWT